MARKPNPLRECYNAGGKPKTTFFTEEDARLFLASKPRALKDMRAYKCGSCPGWHVGHPAVSRG